MLEYNDLYECLRKEKYAEQLQKLPKDFVQQFSDYLKSKKKDLSTDSEDMFAEDMLREKKQLENAFSIFRELLLRRKRKILNLVFVAAETGIMKRDFSDMLSFEQDLFERLVRSVNDADKVLHEEMNGKQIDISSNKMILIKEDIEEFVDMSGEGVGPYKKGDLVNLDSEVAEILVSGKKAVFVDAEN